MSDKWKEGPKQCRLCGDFRRYIHNRRCVNCWDEKVKHQTFRADFIPINIDEYETAIAARDEALNQVDNGTSDDWKEMVDITIHGVALATRFFTSDDVWDALPEDCFWDEDGSPREMRALGPRFIVSARNGICEKTKNASTSKRGHAGTVRIWKSLIYNGHPLD